MSDDDRDKAEARLTAIEAALAAIRPERLDHNGECLDCDEQAGHAITCPWLEDVRAALRKLHNDG